jgi:hypothetical protein
MRTALAERLLAKIMNWNTEEITRERPLLQALADFKYDEYQQFAPGIRFIESLVQWLNQFTEIQERVAAYNFIKAQLIFISGDQVSHLVNIAFSDKINPIIIRKAASALNSKPHLVAKIAGSEEYHAILRKSLFIGLSDGSRIDQFRRSCYAISNEQVFPTYYISEEKAEDMLKELTESGYKDRFNSIFLVDDFTASGKSYFRAEEGKGKIFKFFNLLLSKNDSERSKSLNSLIDTSGSLDIHILFYVATRSALEILRSAISEWQKNNDLFFECSVDAIQILEDDIKEQVLRNKDFVSLAQKYFDSTIIDKHYRKGKHELPYLGFNECGLPLVLNHNTPNNSLPILWFPDGKDYRGLFPRVTRHKE